MTRVLGLRRTHSAVSINSITSFAGSIDTKRAYKKFCRGLFQAGVTAEMISQNEREIHNVLFRHQNASSSSQMDDGTIEDQSQLTELDAVETSLISTDNNITTTYKRSLFGWARPQIDSLVRTLLAAGKPGNTKRPTPTLGAGAVTQTTQPHSTDSEPIPQYPPGYIWDPKTQQYYFGTPPPQPPGSGEEPQAPVGTLKEVLTTVPPHSRAPLYHPQPQRYIWPMTQQYYPPGTAPPRPLGSDEEPQAPVGTLKEVLETVPPARPPAPPPAPPPASVYLWT